MVSAGRGRPKREGWLMKRVLAVLGLFVAVAVALTASPP